MKISGSHDQYDARRWLSNSRLSIFSYAPFEDFDEFDYLLSLHDSEILVFLKNGKWSIYERSLANNTSFWGLAEVVRPLESLLNAVVDWIGIGFSKV